MKHYVYMTKDNGIIYPNFVVASKREYIHKRFNVCIDNVYEYNLLKRVKDWYNKVYNCELILSDSFGVYIKNFYNDVEYIETFSKFREIVNDYRNRE